MKTAFTFFELENDENRKRELLSKYYITKFDLDMKEASPGNHILEVNCTKYATSGLMNR
jgi:hypothetical protein